MRSEEAAAMEGIGPALGSDLNLGAAEAPTLGVIAIGQNFHVVYRVFAGSNDCRSTPHRAGRADSVNTYAVVLILLPGCHCCRPVLGLEDPLRAACRPGSLHARKRLSTSSRTLCAITEDTRRELDHLKNVTPERGHMLNLIRRNNSVDGGRLCIQLGERIGVHGRGLRYCTQLELNVDCI